MRGRRTPSPGSDYRDWQSRHPPLPDGAPRRKRRCGAPAWARAVRCRPGCRLRSPEDQAALAGGQVELVTVINVAAALDDNVGMRLEQADQLVAGGHRLAGEHPPLALRDHPLDQRLIVTDLGLPEDDRWAARPGQPRRGAAQIGQGLARDLDQLAIER